MTDRENSPLPFGENSVATDISPLPLGEGPGVRAAGREKQPIRTPRSH